MNTHHHHHQPHHHHPSPFGTGPGSSAFSLPPTSSIHSHSHSSSSHHPGAPGSLNNHTAHGLHDFTSHSHFNSTVPAIGSSMRYEPPPASPFSLNHPSSHSSSSTTTAGALPGAEPSSVSSFNSHISSLSGFSVATQQTSDPFPHHHHSHLTNGHQRQTPSPVSATSPHPDFTSHTTSRSRSRSRTSTSNPNALNQNPPSTNGGPTRRTRPKRNSVSSVSPPPLHRHNTQPLVIPNTNSTNPRGPVSPLGLHSSNGWFIPQSQHAHQPAEFSLPTPDSVHGESHALNF